jgi:molecular chaperone GrpE (heat shock protein)
MVLTKKPIENLDKTVTELTDHYMKLHREFDTFRGRLLNKEDGEKAANIAKEIHDTYAEIHQIAFWVANRYEWANNVASTHAQFLDDLDVAKKNIHEEN